MSTVESQFPVLNNINITFNGITKLLNGLKPNKSPGSYNLGPRLLKELAEDIATLLLMILHKSLATGEVHHDWRTANVITAFKKGQKYQAENYRPISLASVCCKIMEHVIASQIMNNGQKEDILYPLQHGFFCSGIQFNLLLSPYPCFISLLYLDLYVLGDDALIS